MGTLIQSLPFKDDPSGEDAPEDLSEFALSPSHWTDSASIDTDAWRTAYEETSHPSSGYIPREEATPLELHGHSYLAMNPDCHLLCPPCHAAAALDLYASPHE